MSVSARCPRCQRPLAENAPAGLCPVCLFAEVLTSQAEGEEAISEEPPLFPEDRNDVKE